MIHTYSTVNEWFISDKINEVMHEFILGALNNNDAFIAYLRHLQN
jgi:hypothetical protein